MAPPFCPWPKRPKRMGGLSLSLPPPLCRCSSSLPGPGLLVEDGPAGRRESRLWSGPRLRLIARFFLFVRALERSQSFPCLRKKAIRSPVTPARETHASPHNFRNLWHLNDGLM
ncbi:hypothetical protein LZ32DRAFT_608636 [Colletotrichum eremochloae]|nr:hypothetical protein LZ32DRAFT_608636 [Colletotrichum eremochloae]